MIEIRGRVIALSPGRLFHGRYEIVRSIKTGGMGAIYEVIHVETRRRRALKIMLPSVVANVDLRGRFQLEATVAADIESEHIVEIFDAGVDDETGAPFLVMELLRGEDLSAVVDRRGKLSPGDVVLLLGQVASALDKTHAAGVVHRDLKPDNLFLARRDDGSPKVKILDFGIAKVVAEGGQLPAKTRVLGTPLYMSPEQVRGDGRIGPRADLYALAHIAFALLVGKAYWAEDHDALPLYALMTKIVGGCQVPATERAARYGGEVTEAFGAWFAKATRVAPEERFGSASAMVRALADALGVQAPEERVSSLAPGGDRDRRASGARGAVDGVETAPSTETEASSLRTETEAPAALAALASPRRSTLVRRVAGAVAVAGIAVAVAAFAGRTPSRASGHEAGPAASATRPVALPEEPAPTGTSGRETAPPAPHDDPPPATVRSSAPAPTGAPTVVVRPAVHAAKHAPKAPAPPASATPPSDPRPVRSLD